MGRETSLRTYLVRGNLYLMVIPLFILGAWGYLTFGGFLRNEIVLSDDMTATAVAGRFEEFFQRPVDALARIENVLDRPDIFPREKIDAYLQSVLDTFSFLDEAEVMEADGRIRWMAPFDADFIGLSRAGEAVFEGIKASAGIYWSPTFLSLKDNQPSLAFGRAKGGRVVQCDLNLRSLGVFAASLMRRYGAEIQLRVTDANGVFIYHPDPAKAAQREMQAGIEWSRAEEGEFPKTLREGEMTYLLSARRVGELNGYVIILRPESAAFADVGDFFLGFAFILVFSAGIGVLLSWFRLKRITRSLKKIASVAMQLSHGAFVELGEFGEGFRELRDVGVGFDTMVENLRERESVLRDRERGFRQILEEIKLLAVGIDAKGRILFANECFLEWSGRSLEEVFFRDWFDLFVPPESGFKAMFPELLLESDERHRIECEAIVAAGDRRTVAWMKTVNHDAEGRVSGLTLIGEDVTERLSQERRLEESLREKDILLKEIHHRVKNNLQLITSLLNLQEQAASVETDSRTLRVARDRIFSLALIHENLYASDDFSSVDFREYATVLVNALVTDAERSAIDLVLDMAPLVLTMDDAIPCGLILNEALTNVLKYAFPPHWPGLRRVFVRSGFAHDGHRFLEVRDTGIGMPPDFDQGKSSSLGSMLMRLLAEQLHGELSIVSDGGTAVILKF
jgi:PAS domain S-box-containing protein